MNPTIRNIIAIVIGLAVGMSLNMGLIMSGHALYPIDGLNMDDPNVMEVMAEIMPTMGPKYFVFPFLAHALGTLFGAIVAAVVATNNKMRYALIIGSFFLVGGVMMSYQLHWKPISFVLLDIVLAYIPMAWIGGKIAMKMEKKG
ncbi:hypothetical protein N8987_04680 [Crocinitomix sp.]|nr:hypothetical protein [Crocinitomix sp.]